MAHGWEKRTRLAQVKAMHAMMQNANHEELYMSWINLMPDEPQEVDFEDFANSPEDFRELFVLFQKLIADRDYL